MELDPSVPCETSLSGFMQKLGKLMQAMWPYLYEGWGTFSQESIMQFLCLLVSPLLFSIVVTFYPPPPPLLLFS